jgi:hypothetical protein
MASMVAITPVQTTTMINRFKKMDVRMKMIPTCQPAI